MKTDQSWILDIGAFEGSEGARIRQSLQAEGEYPVLFVEADPLNFSKISTQISDRKLNVAISPQDGWIDFYRYKPETSSVLPLNQTRIVNYIDGHTGKQADIVDWKLREKLRVPSRRLDTLCSELGISRVRYLKVDTQGYDLEVLKSFGDMISIVDELVCEVQLEAAQIYTGGASKSQVLDYLHSKGFLFIRQRLQTYGQELNMYFKRKDLLGNLEKEPVVSILTPCYNGSKFLEKCIQSVAMQEYPFIEHIIQDGASTDGTLEILKKYSKNILWVSEKDNGQSDGLNRALQRCSGDIIGVLNADDEYENDAINWAIENFFRYPDAGVIYGEQNNIDADGNILFTSRGPNPYDFSKIFCCEAVIPAQAAFIRRSAMEKAGFFVDVTRETCPDYEMWVRLGLKVPMQHVSGFVARYRIHGGSEGQQQNVIFKMVQSKREVVQRVTSASDTPLKIKQLKRRAHAGILEWSAWHFLPPHTINNRTLARKQILKAFLVYPYPRTLINLFVNAWNSIVSINYRISGPYWPSIINHLRGVLRRLDYLFLGGMIYQHLYLPRKLKKNHSSQKSTLV